MLPRPIKQLYFQLMRLPMKLSGRWYRLSRAPRAATPLTRVHLGPGQTRYLPGWVNVDANILTARCDVWADLRDPLPFHDNTISVFYSHHVIEHLPDPLLPAHFGELHRCLAPGGLVRIGVPHGDNAARMLLENKPDWFDDFPVRRTSVGGRFTNFLLCQGDHTSILTLSYLQELANAAGFVDLRSCQPGQTFHPNLIGNDVLAGESERTPDCPHTLLIEARKA